MPKHAETIDSSLIKQAAKMLEEPVVKQTQANNYLFVEFNCKDETIFIVDPDTRKVIYSEPY